MAKASGSTGLEGREMPTSSQLHATGPSADSAGGPPAQQSLGNLHRRSSVGTWYTRIDMPENFRRFVKPHPCQRDGDIRKTPQSSAKRREATATGTEGRMINFAATVTMETLPAVTHRSAAPCLLEGSPNRRAATRPSTNPQTPTPSPAVP